MARFSSLIVLLLIAAAGQAAPAGQARATTLAAPFSIDSNGLPDLPTMSGPPGPLTMTELGGNVVACPSQVTFLLSSTTYLDCLEPVSTLAVGTSSASALQLVQLTVSAGLTLDGLPLVYAHKTETVTLLSFPTGQTSWASSATRTRGSASTSKLSSSRSKPMRPTEKTISSVLSSSASRSPHKGVSSPSSRQSLTSGTTQTRARSTSSGRSSSKLQPGGRGPASLSTVSSASSHSSHGNGARSASSASHISSADSRSKNRPTTQATSSVSSTGRSGSNGHKNVPSVTSGPSNSHRRSDSRSNISPTSSASKSPPAPAPSTYSIDGVGFTGNPHSLVAGSTTLTPGGAALITSGHTFSIPVSATGGQIDVDGTLTTLHTPAPSTYSIDGVGFTGNPSSLVAGSTTLTPGGAALITSGHTFSIPVSATGGQIDVDGTLTTLHIPAPSTYSIDGVGFTGNPHSLVAGSTTLTPGGAALITSGHTFSIPVSATGGQIDVDGTLTTLHAPQTRSGSSNSASASAPSSISRGLTTTTQSSRKSKAVVVGSTTSAVSSLTQTPTVTSTETAAPPGASAETLISGAFLFNQWITTTKPGSSTPSVIPIIVPPGGGLPIALWGFLPGPPPGGDLPDPPALEINIPKLKIPCVKLFGLKFGDCSSDDGNHDHNPTDNPTDSKPTHTEPSNTRSTPATTKSQPSSPSRSSSSSRTQSCSDRTATITHVSCATAGTTTSCTTHFDTNVGCSASGSAITSGSCLAKTTVGSSTACCSSVTVSSGSTVCAFADLTQLDMNSPPSDLQTSPPSAQLASEFSAYLATHSGASGGVGTGTAASTTGSVSISSKRHASSTGPASVSATSSAVNPHNRASSTGLTTSGSSSVESPNPTKVASSSSVAANAGPLCIANGEKYECVCSTGTIIVTISSYFNPSSNVCGYTTIPSTPVVTIHTSSTPKPTGAIYTYTDPNHGYVVACYSTYTSEVAGYVITECTGSSTTISTDASIVSFDSVYLVGESSSSAASAASAASVSSAAAVPTARILITYYTYTDDDVFIYQYRAYDGIPTAEIAYCSSATPISFVNLPNGNGDPSDLPTNQLPTFTTHGIKDCNYSSPSSSEAGTVSCPGWANPVQCISVVGSEAQEYQCLTFQGGTEQQPIVDCDWGANP